MSLADNVVHFARLLRAAAVPVGTDRIVLAEQALQVAGIRSRADFHAVLLACLIDRVEHRALFDRAFEAFWESVETLGQPPQSLPPLEGKRGGESRPGQRRLADAMRRHPTGLAAAPDAPIDLTAGLSWSDRERLGKADFEAMSADESLQAQRLVRELGARLPKLPVRRFERSLHGNRVDLHEFLRGTARRGGELALLPRRARRSRQVPLVVLVDISGSMSRYSRMFLHFTYAVAQAARSAGGRVHVFVFGTRLTNVTRSLQGSDPDQAVADVVRAVDDWSGGTRIAACLRELHVVWARRVLTSTAMVLLVTDGLERAELDSLSKQMERLSRSCRRLIWLNPLLRYAEFEPKAGGMRAILPFVDRLMPVHNVESVNQLESLLAASLRDHLREARALSTRMGRAAWS